MKKQRKTHRLARTPGSIALNGRLRRQPTERMLSIHELLQRGTYPNSSTLAAQFQVSRKTVKRDVEFLRDHFDLPIQYDRQRHGFFYASAVKHFPGSPAVTEAEMFSLLVAHKAIAQYHGTPFHQPLQMAFQKWITHLDTHARYSLDDFRQALSFRPFAPEDTDLRVFEAVTRAITQRRALVFQYRKPGTRAPHSRRVHPYHLTCTDNRWYLLGHDTARGDIRTFVLGRISVPRVTDEPFLRPPDFDPEKYLGGSFTVMKGHGDHEVVIEFDAWAADVIRGRQWHASQQVTDLPDGGSHLIMRLSGLEEVERWILSWGTHATVLNPPALAARVRFTATTLVQRYAGNTASKPECSHPSPRKLPAHRSDPLLPFPSA